MATSEWRKLIVVVCLALSGLLLNTAVWAEKPTGPLSVSIKATKAKPGAAATFDVTVTTLMDGELSIIVIPPAGSTVSSGETSWRGEVAARAKKKLSLTIKLPNSEEQEFKALANISGPNGARYGAGARHVIASKTAKATTKERRTLRNGEVIIETPVPASK